NPSRTLHVMGSLSVQRSTDEATGKNAGLAPQKRLYTRADWRFAPSWMAGAAINHVADRAREPLDTRPELADYTTTDVILQRENLWGNWELRGTVQNLFDRDVREPSIAPGNIPFDLPMAGRSVSVQLRYSL